MPTVPTASFDAWELSGAVWTEPVESQPVTSPGVTTRSRSRSRSPSISDRTVSPSVAAEEDPYECVKQETVDEPGDDARTIAPVIDEMTEEDRAVSRVLTAACLVQVKQEIKALEQKSQPTGNTN